MHVYWINTIEAEWQDTAEISNNKVGIAKEGNLEAFSSYTSLT